MVKKTLVSFTDSPKMQTLTPLKSHKTEGYCWRTPKRRTFPFVHHRCLAAALRSAVSSESAPRSIRGSSHPVAGQPSGRGGHAGPPRLCRGGIYGNHTPAL